MGDGDGWVQCAAGHRHWGRHGAAGLLLTGPGEVVLQHRSIHTHEGGTWALPGGARDSHEDPVQTALREAGEEAGIVASEVLPLGLARADHQGWSYTTVLGRAVGDVRPFAANWESDEVRWWNVDDVHTLHLHAGFAAAWPNLQANAQALQLVVDSANVVGSRPDGWWRDRPAATRRLRDALTAFARRGVASGDLPSDMTSPGVTALLPQVTLVVEGAARSVDEDESGERDTGEWWTNAVRTVPAVSSGDDEIVAQAEAVGGRVMVVTADRALRERLAPSVHVVGPGWLLDQIDAPVPFR
ncbi:MAG: ADP-ribose pyrophosphatase [Pseudonocardiales bacterium]|nr:ADP-ribose pyrophosphatase [Pseudonocardiales bacterium]